MYARRTSRAIQAPGRRTEYAVGANAFVAARAAVLKQERTGYGAFVEVAAMETLATVEAPVDMVLLDGWKDLYLPILKMLQPKLRPRAVVLADNIFTFRKALRPYVEYVQRPDSGFVSGTLDISDGFELSVFMGA